MYVDCEVGLNCDNCENLLVLETLFRCCVYIFISPDLSSRRLSVESNQVICYCSDFRYESNGIFVLGVGFFFLQTNFDFLTSHF